MLIGDEDMGLEMKRNLLDVDHTETKESRTLLVGQNPDGMGIHLYQISENYEMNLVCATYTINGELDYHERGESVTLRAFQPGLSVEQNSLSGYVEEVLDQNGIHMEKHESVVKPGTPSPPFEGPQLTDLTLTPPF